MVATIQLMDDCGGERSGKQAEMSERDDLVIATVIEVHRNVLRELFPDGRRQLEIITFPSTLADEWRGELRSPQET
jgi:hypothetical protein